LGLCVLADLILRPARSRRYFTISTRSGTSPPSGSIARRGGRVASVFIVVIRKFLAYVLIK
jgi:hypothetical protein